MFLAEVSLLTNDVIRLSDFYKKVLDTASDCNDAVHQTLDTRGVSLTIYDDGSTKNNRNENISLAFTVDDVDKEYERLRKMGITILEPPTTRPWGARNMHFQDPDGNHIYFRTLEVH